jgi:uncharacterized damage-inducible protein DinB
MAAPLIDVLLAYDAWANRQMLEACRPLTPAQFERPLDAGHGSLAATIDHLIMSLFFFADRLNRVVPVERYDPLARSWTADDLISIFEHGSRELRTAVTQALSAHALTDMLSWTDTDQEDVDPLDQVSYAVALAQIIDHGIHHRTQAMTMLRQLGIETPTEWHPFEWDEATRSIRQ